MATYINPITTSFEVLTTHRALVREMLLKHGVSADDVSAMMDGLEVDRGLFLSLDREYQKGRNFSQFCEDHGLARALFENEALLPSTASLYRHQEEAIQHILEDETTIVSTGTGSGKTEAFLIPILNHCLTHSGLGVKALIIYPMNALANDQVDRIHKIVRNLSEQNITCDSFIGSTDEPKRADIRRNPPDILITNHVMLDWMLTRVRDQAIFKKSEATLRYIVLDEIHTYRGNRAAHIKYLLRRLKARLIGSVVQIGTSATLKNEEHDRRRVGSVQQDLDDFVKTLLDVESYAFVPAYYVESGVGGVQDPGVLPVPSKPEALGWTFQANPTKALRLMENLTGWTYGRREALRARNAFDRHPFVRALKHELETHGSITFVEVVGLISRLLPPDHGLDNLVPIAKAYLSLITYFNFLGEDNEDPALLNFRFHLFVKDVRGYLKRCLQCGRYHSGDQDFCRECGFPLFRVLREDVRTCIGKMSGRRLRWELHRESTDRPDSFYVLIRFGDGAQGFDSTDSAIRVRGALNVDEEAFEVAFNPQGKFHLAYAPWSLSEDLKEHSIVLASGRDSHEYVYNLVQTLLDTQTRRDKRRLLGFVDSRERASWHASRLQDEFVDHFFEAYMRMYASGFSTSVENTLAYLQQQKPDANRMPELEKQVFRELDLWFWRRLCTPPDYDSDLEGFLTLQDARSFNVFERSLLEIFVQERALFKPRQEIEALPEGDFIKFDQYWARDFRGIHLDSDQGSEDPTYPSISLGEQAQKYRDFVDKHGSRRIAGAVDDLVDGNVLFAYKTSDGKTHYALSLDAVRLHAAPPSERDETYEALRDHYLLTAALHSSEVGTEERKRIEAEFKEGERHVIIATPTLEMGIDIGDLEHVLMIGVPPFPSNYVQRAGRAGRSREGGQNTLILTICREGDEHDAYYFRHPKRMIDGVIAPPRFNPRVTDIMRQHVRAFLLRGSVDRLCDLRAFYRELDERIRADCSSLRAMFGEDAWAYTKRHLRDAVVSLGTASKERKISPQRYAYQHGFFPDHDFRRDQVYVLEVERGGKLLTRGVEEDMLSEYAISERPPESAYTAFAPGRITAMAGGIYAITSEGDYEDGAAEDELHFRSYRFILAKKAVRRASKRRVYTRYERSILFKNDCQFAEKRKILGVAYHPKLKLYYINHGCVNQKQETEQFADDEGSHFDLGYELERQALVLRFASSVCRDDTLVLSFVSALYGTIKAEYELEQSALSIVTGLELLDPEERWKYVALYDATGNGHMPIERMAQTFDRLVRSTQHRMEHCPNACKTGCYRCMRSYETQFFGSRVEKPVALMMTRYLLGEGRFRPALGDPPQDEEAPSSYDLTLRLDNRGGTYTVHAPEGRSYSDQNGGDQNAVIFNLLGFALRSEYRPGMETLKLLLPQPYLIEAVERGQLNRNKSSLARFQFEALRFAHVKAERG
jgi:ATP-dependent helicase YprA (DUF1998 family)